MVEFSAHARVDQFDDMGVAQALEDPNLSTRQWQTRRLTVATSASTS